MRSLPLALFLLAWTACDGPAGAADASLEDAALADAGGDAEAASSDAATPDAAPSDAAPSDAGSRPDGGDDAGSSPACDPATLDESLFLETRRDALCEMYRVCAPYTSVRNEFCSPSIHALWTREWADGLASGELRLVPEEACRCLDALRSGECQIWAVLEACAAMFEHTSSACASAGDCDAGETCDLSGGLCPGTCVDLPGEGMPCLGFACDVGLRCVSGSCTLPAAIGEPCEEQVDCAFELFCDRPDRDAPGTCRGPAALGERCGANAYCVAGLVCTDGVCGAGQPLGASCAGGSRCALGLRCDDGTCTRFLGPGSACATDEECWAGFHCDGTCRPLPIVGEPCPLGRCYLGTCVAGSCAPSAEGAACTAVHVAAIDECEEGLYCDPSTSRCTPGSGAGESCIVELQCSRGLTCDEGHCAAPECVL